VEDIGFEPDLVFADPPYDDEEAYSWLEGLDWSRLCRPGARLFVEARSGTSMPGWKRREYGGSVLFERRTERKPQEE